MFAVNRRKKDKIKTLLEFGANVDKDSLLSALDCRFYEAVEIMFSRIVKFKLNGNIISHGQVIKALFGCNGASLTKLKEIREKLSNNKIDEEIKCTKKIITQSNEPKCFYTITKQISDGKTFSLTVEGFYDINLPDDNSLSLILVSAIDNQISKIEKYVSENQTEIKKQFSIIKKVGLSEDKSNSFTLIPLEILGVIVNLILDGGGFESVRSLKNTCKGTYTALGSFLAANYLAGHNPQAVNEITPVDKRTKTINRLKDILQDGGDLIRNTIKSLQNKDSEGRTGK